MAVLILAETFNSYAWLCTSVRVKSIRILPHGLLLLRRGVQLGSPNITVHCAFLYYFLFSILLHPTHIQETCLPAGRGSAQRKLQPVRKNPHLAPHASLHHPTPLSLTSPMLPPWHPSLLFSSAPLLFLPFDSDHWVSLCLLLSEAPFRLADGQEERRWTHINRSTVYVCVYEMEKKREERLKLFFLGGVKCQTGSEVGRLLTVKPAWGLAFQATEWWGCG